MFELTVVATFTALMMVAGIWNKLFFEEEK